MSLSSHLAGALAAQANAWPVATVARVCLVAMFPFSALDKVLNRGEALTQARSSIVPAPLAPLLLALGMALEIAAPICIVAGWLAEPAALMLSLYCMLTALLFHAFWSSGDFWRKGPSTGRMHFWDFMKNFGLAGGLLLVAIGRGF